MSKLVIVGAGIKSIAHLTEETKKVIQIADKVLYLVNENNLKAWIKREAKESESLDSIYFSLNKRVDAYHYLTSFILEEYRRTTSLCVVFYGHPTVFAESALNAVKQISIEGGDAVILPAVSSMDCLFSDLQIDPGERGFFCMDATELLIYERQVDRNAHVIIWQVANLGTYDLRLSKKLPVLCNYLTNFYSSSQPACIYEAAVFPTQKPRIEWHTLECLVESNINPISTLYIPPVERKNVSQKYLSLLEMDITDFKLST